MSAVIRALEPGELDAFIRADALAWGQRITDEDIAHARSVLEPDRVTVADDSGAIVAGAAIYSLALTLPGARQLPMPGVTYVFVHPTHRRRGLLRGMMQRQLEGMSQGGEAIAGLIASQSSIYRRFGFGPASQTCTVRIERAHARFASVPEDDGGLELVDRDTALRVFPEVFDAVRATDCGMVDRSPAWWRVLLREEDEEAKEGARPPTFVVHRGSAGVDGTARYRLQQAWPDGVADGTVTLHELFATTPQAYAALWRFVLDLDLTSRLEAWRRPVDEPLLHLLADPRRLRQSARDDLHIRVIDVPRALRARGYRAPGAVVMEVRDRVCPWVEGRWRLQADGGDASCERADTRTPDLVLDAAALGSVYLGDVSVELLRRAGRVDEVTPGGVERADALFGHAPRPFLPHLF